MLQNRRSRLGEGSTHPRIYLLTERLGFFYSLVMRHRAIASVFASLVFSSAIATEITPVAVVKTFEMYQSLNAEFLSAVESGRSKSGRTYADLRKAVEDYSNGPFETALTVGVSIVCRSGNAEIVRALFKVILATRNSASESPATALGQSFMCQPAVVSKEYRKLSLANRQVVYDTLEFGFYNAKLDHPSPWVDLSALEVQLRSIAPSQAK